MRTLSARLAGDGKDQNEVEQRIYSTLPHLSPSSSASAASSSSSSSSFAPSTSQSVASLVDHTVLKADASTADIQTLCREAHTHHFYSICVNPYHVRTALHTLSELSPSRTVLREGGSGVWLSVGSQHCGCEGCRGA